MRENYEQDLNKKTLNELIQLFHEERVVERLVQAQQEGGLIKVYSVYAELKTKFFGRIGDFKNMLQISAKAKEPFINGSDYEIKAEDSLQVCLICIMSNINEITLLKDWFQLLSALREVEGEYERLAQKFYKFLGVTVDCEGDNFTAYSSEVLLERFFSD